MLSKNVPLEGEGARHDGLGGADGLTRLGTLSLSLSLSSKTDGKNSSDGGRRVGRDIQEDGTVGSSRSSSSI